MNFKIKAVFLIPKNSEKEIRHIPFSLDKVNVITGGSERGKSSIISIVDYCLCSGYSSIPIKIRNYTKWFGIHIVLSDKHELIIARKDGGEKNSSGDMYIREGLDMTIPKIIISNSNINEIKHRLNTIARLSYLDFNEDDEKAIGFNSRPSIRDFAAFLFQPQYIIANQSTLFYKTDQMANRLKLINIFKYVLKAVDNKYLEVKEELSSLEKKISDLYREKERRNSNLTRFRGELKGYYLKAIEFGILPVSSKAVDNCSDSELIDELYVGIKNVESGTIGQISVESIKLSSERLSELITREQDLTIDINNLRYRNELISGNINANIEYRLDLVSQHQRLKNSSWFLNLLKSEEQLCPFCNSNNSEHNREYVRDLIKANNKIISKGSQLVDNTTVLSAEQKKLQRNIHEKLKKIGQIRSEINIVRTKSQKENKELSYYNSIYKFVGKVETELKNFTLYSNDTKVDVEIANYEAQRKKLLKKVDENAITARFERAKKNLAGIISHYARMFNAENSETSISFNEKDLTLKFSTDGRVASLYEIGSGSNYMAYHISTLLAFHELFLSFDHHPCPNFIFFDQPTQVYFPETDLEISEKSEDMKRVRKIFEVLNESVNRTKGKLQVFVLEHVGDYAWKDLKNIELVKRWRDDVRDINDRALIPKSWKEN